MPWKAERPPVTPLLLQNSSGGDGYRQSQQQLLTPGGIGVTAEGDSVVFVTASRTPSVAPWSSDAGRLQQTLSEVRTPPHHLFLVLACHILHPFTYCVRVAQPVWITIDPPISAK